MTARKLSQSSVMTSLVSSQSRWNVGLLEPLMLTDTESVNPSEVIPEKENVMTAFAVSHCTE